jgi:hypothetical protein
MRKFVHYIATEFTRGGKHYTYTTYLDFVVGDQAIVRVKEGLKIVTVVEIAPKLVQNIAYKRIIGKFIPDKPSVGKSAMPDDDIDRLNAEEKDGELWD